MELDLDVVCVLTARDSPSEGERSDPEYMMMMRHHQFANQVRLMGVLRDQNRLPSHPRLLE